jgi:mannose-1-phosphate guanylyltransferase
MKIFILCGGSGTRLWPLSRALEPKQFLPLFNGKSLFQKTLDRNKLISDEVIVISNKNMSHFIHSQIAGTIENYRIISETIGRNTAPAIALGSMVCQPDDIILVLPSDHLIQKTKQYEDAVLQAKKLAKKGFIVTFGIQPSHPETGFGYIEADGENVLAFHEKPSIEIAEEYFLSKNHFWNSGMFCFKASTLLEELQQYAPDIYNASKKLIEKLPSTTSQDITLPKKDLLQIPSLSIDYAIMEHSTKVKVIPCDLGWSDLGSFDSLFEQFRQQDSSSNISLTRQAISTQNSHNNLIIGSQRKIALIGVENLIIADTPDALLILKQDQSQQVKMIVSDLKIENPSLLKHHTLVHRPWGSYEVLVDEPKYKVKRIIVKPKQKLSLQKHLFRSEHWTIVEGTAWIINGSDAFELTVNQQTYIPQETIHRVENQKDIDLVFIEVQYGSSTSEDDIIRLEDMYGRI